jgi:hypothetical protein
MRRGFLLDKPKKKKEARNENPQAQAAQQKPLIKAESAQPINPYYREFIHSNHV